MKLLLDTHVALWWLRDSPLLRQRCKTLIAHPDSDLLVSMASFWEISIKFRFGKIAETGTAFYREAIAGELTVVNIAPNHLAALERLEMQPGHKDPFDHLILAQSIAEGATLLTNDGRMLEYDVPTVRA